MTLPIHVFQQPAAGERRLYFRGDQVCFEIEVQPPTAGRAFVRTNLGHASTIRREIIDQVENNVPRMSRDWFDIAMHETGPGRFQAVIGLDEVGHFEA